MKQQEELRKQFNALYETMANSKDVADMQTFGNVLQEMMAWMIANKPDYAQEWIEKLDSVKWENYLTRREAEKILSEMQPKAPWTNKEAWKQALEQRGYVTQEEPHYNPCALWVTMNMIMSDSSETLRKYIDEDAIFKLVHDLAVDKLKDQDGVFDIRNYFNI